MRSVHRRKNISTCSCWKKCTSVGHFLHLRYSGLLGYFRYGALVAIIFTIGILNGCTDHIFQSHRQITRDVKQYEKAEFRIVLEETFQNPYNQREIALNMILRSPSGKSITLPCFFDESKENSTTWTARFTPREIGEYKYHFECLRGNKIEEQSSVESFSSSPSNDDGFLHINDLWTLRFDSGKPFRGIGENVGWEPRSFSNPKWTYDYLLPRLSQNGANFFRSWMAPNNFPLEWKTVRHTNRYTNTDEYFNPDGIRRLDEVVELADSLGLYMMLTFDSHNALIEGNQWDIHNYNKKNGGPAETPTEFFTLPESRERYRNRLRYIVARWGYSPHIAAWEFFNEIDNAAFSDTDTTIIPHEAITDWHREMTAYLKEIDPYNHIVTTSVSHRQIEGLYSVDEIDLNQMHIYKRTEQIPAGVKRYTKRYRKPFVWGEFAYEWDWNKDFGVIGDEMDFDYKRGLWYGMFSPTPILPMSWWWEYFDERGLTTYFRGVREINDLMLEAGKGSFEHIEAQSRGAESYAVKCGDTWFAYLLNSSTSTQTADIWIPGVVREAIASLQLFDPAQRSYITFENFQEDGNGIKVEGIELNARAEVVLILHGN